MRRSRDGTFADPQEPCLVSTDPAVAAVLAGGWRRTAPGWRSRCRRWPGEPRKYVTSIWRIDGRARRRAGPADPQRGGRERRGVPARRLAAVHLPAARPRRRPGGEEAGRRTARQGRTGPAAAGCCPRAAARPAAIAAPPGGVAAVAAARNAAVFACAASVFPAAAGAKQDAALRKARADAGVNAILHDDRADPVLGPRPGAGQPAAAGRRTMPAGQDRADAELPEPRDLTPGRGPGAGRAGLRADPGRLGRGDRLGDRRRRRPAGITTSWSSTPAPRSRRVLLTAPGRRLRGPAGVAGRRAGAGRPRPSTTATTGPATSPWSSRRWPVRARTAPERARATCWPGSTAARPRRPGRRTRARCSSPPMTSGRRPVFRVGAGGRRRHADHPRRRRLRAAVPVARRPLPLRAAQHRRRRRPPPVRLDLDEGAAAEPVLLNSPVAAVPVPGTAGGGDRDRGRRHGHPRLAGAAGDGVGRRARAAAAVGARRPAGELERLVLAVEPVADDGARLRRAAARPGAVHRLRPAHDRARPRPAGAKLPTPTSWRSPTRSSRGRTSTATAPR